MSWEQLAKKSEESSKGGMFLKLEDGQEVVGVFRGDPFLFYKEKYPGKREYAHKVQGSSFRFRINFVMKVGDGYEPRILEQGSLLANVMTAHKAEYGIDCWYKIKREGTKLDTEYHLFYKGDLTPEELEKVNEVSLVELKLSSQRTRDQGVDIFDPPPPDDTPLPTEEDIPF